MKSYFRLLTVALVFFISGLIIYSCAPSARIPIQRPAEINLVGTKSIAIGEITGNTGNVLSDSITQKLFESGHYEVLDRQNINRIMSEHSLNISGAVDESSAASLGKLVGASALIFGNSNAQYRQQTETSDTYRDKNGRYYKYYYKEGEARVNTMLKVVDLQTGKIIAVKNFTENASDRTQETNQWPPDPDRNYLISKAVNNTSERFMKLIAPYTEYVRVEFENCDVPESKTGIEYAKIGQWNEALSQFKSATERQPNDAAAWFNLGLGYEYNYRFDEAIDALKKSNAIKPSKKTIEEIGNCNNLRSEQEKLQMQMSDN